MVIESDEILLRKWVTKRDRDALSQLFSRHYSRVYRLALKLTRDLHHAEDIAQFTFVALAKKTQLNDVHLVRNWLMVIARHRAYRLLKREANRSAKDTEYGSEGKISTTSPNIEEELKDDLDKALASLPVAQWFLLRLYFFNGLNLDEIAQEVRTSRPTAKKRIDSGLENLREYFRKNGLLTGLALLIIGGDHRARASMATSAGATYTKAGALKAALITGTCLVGVAGVIWIPPLVADNSPIVNIRSKAVSAELYDLVVDAFAPQLSEKPWGLPSRIAQMSQSEYSFWLGSRDHFVRWTKSHYSELVNPDQLCVVSAPVLNLNRVNQYPTAQGFGVMACGSLDWQNSTYVNPTLDLLQQAIAVELWGREHGVVLDHQDRLMMIDRLVRGYRFSMGQPYGFKYGIATEHITAGEPIPGALDSYQQMVDHLTDGQRLLRRQQIHVGDSAIMLDDDATSWDQIAKELEAVAANSPATANLLRTRNKAEIRAAIRDVASIVVETDPRYAGNHAILVWLRRPFKNNSTDGMIILRQSMTTDTERQGLVDYDLRHPARRSIEHMRSLVENRPFFCNWCKIGNVSYTLELLEPWSRLAVPRPSSRQDLLNTAEICGRFTGTVHRRALNAVDAQEYAGSLPASSICQPMEKYLDNFVAAFASFQIDSRTRQAVTQMKELRAAVKALAQQ